jgi:hypothetical protein
LVEKRMGRKGDGRRKKGDEMKRNGEGMRARSVGMHTSSVVDCGGPVSARNLPPQPLQGVREFHRHDLVGVRARPTFVLQRELHLDVAHEAER